MWILEKRFKAGRPRLAWMSLWKDGFEYWKLAGRRNGWAEGCISVDMWEGERVDDRTRTDG